MYTSNEPKNENKNNNILFQYIEQFYIINPYNCDEKNNEIKLNI